MKLQRIALLMAAMLLAMLPASAVLKEKDLARTLGVLRAELEYTYRQQKQNMADYEKKSSEQHKKLVEYMQRSEQIALMLYSQNADFTFDVAYACQQATDLYHQLHQNTMPYASMQSRIRGELKRYDALIRSLEELPPAKNEALGRLKQLQAADTLPAALTDSLQHLSGAYMLDASQQADREKCLLYAKAIRNNFLRMMSSISEDNLYYTRVTEKVEELNTYAHTSYKELQQNIFVNGGDNYFKVLASLPTLFRQTKRDVSEKYMPLDSRSETYSEWRGPMVILIGLFTLFYVLIATALSNVLLRFCVPRKWLPADFESKRRVYFLALGVLIFAVSVMLVRSFITRNFLLMAAGLLINIAWLAEAIFVSLLIRLNGSQVRQGIRLYLPFICMAFLVIVFRIILIPNNLVSLIYPPLLLGFSVWQLHILRDNKVSLPTSDVFYSAVSFLAMLVATVMAWCGYVLLAVEVMVWWIFQLAAIQSITSCFHLMRAYEKRYLANKISTSLGHGTATHNDTAALLKKARRGEYINLTWAYDFVNLTVVPVLGVASVLLSIYWAADIFEMTDICRNIFYYHFIDQEGVIQISLYKTCLVAAVWFGFRYINYTARSFYRYFKKRDAKATYQFNFTLADNIIAIITWGIYFLYALVLLQVPRSGISVVTAGLATGLGFAMKGLLENFFYGISLMTGRVRVGDYIECDGIQGKVESITYQSTQVITLDGSVIAFLNSALFSKNFKNLTRNHSYELCKVPVGVAYGTDVERVRTLLVEAVTAMDGTKTPDGRNIVKEGTSVSVIFSGFGDNSVDLTLCVWVLVEAKGGYLSRVKELIYDTLNAAGIEIPFPQRDIYIRQMTAEVATS